MAPRTSLKVVHEGEAPRNAREALTQQKMEHLQCRDLRHPWSVVGLFYVKIHGKQEIHRRLVCSRCGTEATDRWTPGGGRINRQYKYVEGYEAKGLRIKPKDVRREVLNRVDVYESEEDMLGALFRGGRKKRA